MSWYKFEGTSNNKQFRQRTEKEQLRNIISKLGSISGYFTGMRFEVKNGFEEVHRLLIQQQNYLYSIQHRAEQYFYITVILFLISFGQQQLG
ncbi:hypothetical protein [Rickettsia endosymbiont of Polydrusus tereticollis]|uniref:hypothetical protein n=1 Tax=Rickettsia endosymbiont of Polydrusus tereticollis TaxID=3066251 RepID=UPI003133190F